MSPRDVLKQYYGYDNFRPLQEEIVASVLAGRDTLALLPTGGGKSVCFQVPTLVMASERETNPMMAEARANEAAESVGRFGTMESVGNIGGLCLVVTPLIALMKDQVENLWKHGVRAAAIYTGLSYDKQKTALDNCQFGPYRFLYVSPERLESEDFRKRLLKLPITLIAVDEAHCISEWGYDFRPSYLKIGEIRNLLEQRGHVPILALTATATPDTIRDIQDRLGFAEQNVFRKSFRRPNLRYVVRYVGTPVASAGTPLRSKDEELIHILSRVKGSALVYCRNRKRCKELADFINASFGSGYADFYHAGLSAVEREQKQQRWKDSVTPLMVCTNAFGMGVDKPDVRLVIHYTIPSSIESYFQEAGRAGRDEQPAYCVLLFDYKTDREQARKRVGDNYPEKEYIEKVYHSVCDYLVVGAGSGLGYTWALHIDDLCQHMHLQVNQTISALHILAQAGYIEFEEDRETRPRVMLNIPRSELRHVHLGEGERKLLDYLMRDYPGIYTDLQYIRIDSDHSLEQMDASRSDVHDLLASMAARGILTYIPRTVASRFTLVRERQTHIVIPERIYEQRKERYTQRLAAMVRYAELPLSTDPADTKIAPEDYLVRYFGEE